MQTSQIQIVQDSFAFVAPQADDVANLFYSNLFTLDPSLRVLFRGDMAEQGRKLMSSLSLVVAGLRDPERILPALVSLGQRHVAYGVTPEHYATVGQALLNTLEQGLGERFDGETRAAWSAAYTMIATHMITAANGSAMRGSEAQAE